MSNIKILKRLFNDYTKKYIFQIFLALIFSLILAASTSSIAWLLDPAVEKLFIQKKQSLMLLIPLGIILAFASKGLSLYLAKSIMISVGEEVRKAIQIDMMKNLIKADTETIEKRHSGKFITNLISDVNFMTTLVSVGILNLFKDSLTLIGLLIVMFYQNWKLSLIAIVMIPLASFFARYLGKRVSKVTVQAMDMAATLNTHLMEIFRNHKLIKVFQKETYETSRANNAMEELKNKGKKLAILYARSSPIMEFLTGIMIAILIYYSGNLIMKEEIALNNFFSFLAAMMLAYQPVRSLSTLNLTINQGLAAAKRILPIIDQKHKILEEKNFEELIVQKGTIRFEKVNFNYDSQSRIILKDIDLNISGGEMTSLVGHTGAGKSTILNLIPRFYDCDRGDIKIDEQSIKQRRLSSLRKNISLVSQETTLFDDTIINNIKYANLNATDDDIKEAARLSFSEEFINLLPNKYNTLIGENGIHSLGEKQRLSIARAF